MDEEVFPDSEVQDLINQYYVPVRIDESEDIAPFQKYNIVSIPALIVLDSSGKELARAGFMDVETIKAWLRDTADKK